MNSIVLERQNIMSAVNRIFYCFVICIFVLVFDKSIRVKDLAYQIK